MPETATLDGFDVRNLTFRGRSRDVVVSKTGGRPVVIMHELLGLSPTVVAFARLVAAEGFKVYAPVLFGVTDPPTRKMAALGCLVSEFKVLTANGPGLWADWIRDLAETAYEDCKATPGKGVGVIGLCLTGNLALSATLSPVVTAPVMSEPSLPFGGGSELHVSRAELANAKLRIQNGGLEIRGYRYQRDRICPAAKFKRLQAEFGPAFVGTTIPADSARLHSVFTEHLRDEQGNFRHGEVATLIAHLRKHV